MEGAEDTEPGIAWVSVRDDAGNAMVLDEVVDNIVYVRVTDPGDLLDSPIPIRKDQSISTTTAIAFIGLHSSGVTGANDMMFPIRVVPDGRGPGVVFGRTLAFGEEDDGRRIHVRAGEQLAFRPGAIAIALDGIDEFYRAVDPDRPFGSLATALRVWLGIGSEPHGTEELNRIAWAAAHRLDAAASFLHRAAQLRDTIETEPSLRAVKLVAKADEIVHLTQEGVVALARSIALVQTGVDHCKYEVALSIVVQTNASALKALRDSYEHIEERATGHIGRGRPDERAKQVFETQALIRGGTIEYLEHRLDIEDLPAILDACRQAIKALVAGAAEGSNSESKTSQ